MDVLYKTPFRKFIKKQPRAFQLAIEDEAERVKREPQIGEEKKGDLSGFRVHKFRFKGQLYLIAYRMESNCLIMYMIDIHENFYRSLKRYIREVE